MIRLPWYYAALIAALIALSPALYAQEPPDTHTNRLRFTYGRAAASGGEFFQPDGYMDAVGGSYERILTPDGELGLQVDVSRPRYLADSWTVSPSVNLHFGPGFIAGALAYHEEPGTWDVGLGGGLDGCTGRFCGQFAVRYWKDLTEEDGDFIIADESDWTATLGLGVGW